jgi:hypothetical protein
VNSVPESGKRNHKEPHHFGDARSGTGVALRCNFGADGHGSETVVRLKINCMQSSLIGAGSGLQNIYPEPAPYKYHAGPRWPTWQFLLIWPSGSAWYCWSLVYRKCSSLKKFFGLIDLI